METFKFSTVVNNIKCNFVLLFSAAAALCLFLSPSLFSFLLIAAAFVMLLVAAACCCLKKPELSTYVPVWGFRLVTLVTILWGIISFQQNWLPSSLVAAVAQVLHLSSSTLLLLVGILGGMVGFYAVYTLLFWLVYLGQLLITEQLPVSSHRQMLANLKHNWFFPVSAFFFFTLTGTLTLGQFAGTVISALAALLAATQISSISRWLRKQPAGLKILALLSAIGICWGGYASIDSDWSTGTLVPDWISLVCAVGAVYFVCCCLAVFWREMQKIFSENGVFRGVTFAEWIIYGLLLALTLALVIGAFIQTDGFYGTIYDFDIIYTSDSPALVKGNIYLALNHPENDLRQPLFAVFAAPFTAIPYLIGKLLSASAPVQAILVNSVQIAVLFAAHFLLTRMMRLNPVKRICFMVLTSCAYPHLLFSLMMEQYIFAYFWLIFCVYLICENRHRNHLAFWGAGGTLLTSMILLPFLSDKHPLRKPREWFWDMVTCGLEFVGVMLVMGRFDVIAGLTDKMTSLSRFAGKELTLLDKLYQYTGFIHDCFLSPAAGADPVTAGHISWQLYPVTEINLTGTLIMLLAIISLILNWEKKSSRLAGFWCGFSVIMLVGLGWGTQENGLILYALYFGWAFWVLLFQLVEKVGELLHIPALLPVLSIGISAVLATVNIPAIAEMVDFAIFNFPT